MCAPRKLTQALRSRANELPRYQQNIHTKLTAIRTPGKGAFGRATESVKELGKELAGPQTAVAPTAPVLNDRASRDEVVRSPRIVETRTEAPHANKRSWEKEALIIGGSAGAGTAIGAVAGGKKAAGVGAAAGGVGGLIFDLITRDKK